MAINVQVAGPALVKIDAGQGSGIETLGYTINGVNISDELFAGDVHGDQNGGDEGPPIDIQYFGEIARIRMELSKWDFDVASKVEGRLASTAAGVIGTPGCLFLGDTLNTNYFRLIISPSKDTAFNRNFGAAIPRNAIEVNIGTKYSRFVIDWECHALSGILWDTTIT